VIGHVTSTSTVSGSDHSITSTSTVSGAIEHGRAGRVGRIGDAAAHVGVLHGLVLQQLDLKLYTDVL